MPHQRIRYLESNIKKCMGFSGLVGVLGHRQVGKTTLLEKLCKSYYSLDRIVEANAAQLNPEEYLKERSGTWVGLDECQIVPELFPELKEWVRVHKKPGQFLLSGSVRFTSREAIRESLTGRIINLELLPLVVSELDHAPLSTFCPDILALETLNPLHQWQFKSSSELKRYHQLIDQYLEFGGLPSICFIREEKLRIQKINEQINTLLDRDLRMVKKIQLSLSDLKAILVSLAGMQGQPIDYTRIKNETGVSTPSIKKVIYALEAIFLIRTISIEGSTRGSTIFFEDLAEYSVMSERAPSFVEKLTHFCFTNLRAQFAYQLGQSTQIFQYRTRGGAYIPLGFKNQSGCLGIVPLASSDQVASVLGSVNSFLKTYDRSKVLIVHTDQKPLELIQPRVLALPLGQVI